MMDIFAGQDLKAGDYVYVDDNGRLLLYASESTVSAPLGVINRDVEESGVVWIDEDIGISDSIKTNIERPNTCPQCHAPEVWCACEKGVGEHD